MSSSFLPIEEALEVFRQGHPIVAMDDENRENEGDLIMAAEFATTEKLGFILRHTTGIICAPMLPEIADELNLPPMVVNNEDPKCTAFTVSCDLIEGCSTGVSAHDRALTLRALAHPCRMPTRFHRPGHVFPLRAKPGGVLERRGHTEACVDLCRLAGVQPVGVIGELMDDEGKMMRFPACQEFAKQHGLHIITIEALAEYRRKHLDNPFPQPPSASFALSPMKPTAASSGLKHNAKDCLRWSAPASPIDPPVSPYIPSSSTVELAADCVIPIERGGEFLGEWKQKVFVDRSGYQHIALVMGDVSSDPSKPVIARVHSECFTGDLLGSRRCDCGLQLDQSFRIIAKEGRGVIVYCGGHEGRGIGLISKIRAYKLQSEENCDTYEANSRLGFPADMRSYEAPLAILKALGIRSVELLTNNPLKVKSLQGIVAAVRPLRCSSNEHNERYLNDKHAFEQKVAKTMNGSLETMVASLCDGTAGLSCSKAVGQEILDGQQTKSPGQRCLFREGSS